MCRSLGLSPSSSTTLSICEHMGDEKLHEQDTKVLQVFDKKPTEAQDTHRYLVFVVKEHVNSFLAMQI